MFHEILCEEVLELGQCFVQDERTVSIILWAEIILNISRKILALRVFQWYQTHIKFKFCSEVKFLHFGRTN